MLIARTAGEEVLLCLHFSMGTVWTDAALSGQPVLSISARLYSQEYDRSVCTSSFVFLVYSLSLYSDILQLCNLYLGPISLSLSLSLSHTHTLSLSLSLSLSHTHTHSLSLSLQDSVSYPLVSVGSQWRRFSEGVCEFVSLLVRGCRNSLLYDDFLFSSFIALLTGLADSQVRAFRHTSTLIGELLYSDILVRGTTLNTGLNILNQSYGEQQFLYCYP